jgi:crotonobetainyl-CoA:carnitine CoA-transferase CaiB-like acyl-CoA transferase
LTLAGGSPRYRIYPAKDGRLIACGALEQKFWDAFTRTIGLPPELTDDGRDPAATQAGVARLIAAKTAEEWRPLLAKADCCVTVIASLEEAMRDPHFLERGLFEHQLANAAGSEIAALPVPIAKQFRDYAMKVKRAPGAKD